MAKILIIDDEASVRTLLRTVLEEDGHSVVDAENGRHGLELYKQQPVDLVITDILMPEMSGLDLILELTRVFLNVKVIAITGATGEQNGLHTARLLGARHTLRKPFSVTQLLSAVRYELAH